MAQWTGTHSPGAQLLPTPMAPKVMGFLKSGTGTAGIRGANWGWGQFIIAVQEEGVSGDLRIRCLL